MTTLRFGTLFLIFGFVSGCSSLPYCFSLSSAEAAKYSTKSCPAWMCHPGSGNTVCVTKVGNGEMIKPTVNANFESEPTEPESIAMLEPVEETTPMGEPEPMYRSVEIEPQHVAPGNLDQAPDGTFVLQVIALSSYWSAEKFVAESHVDGAQIIAVDSEGATRYAVVTEFLSTREEGLEAADAFTASHPGTIPWVRRAEEMREAVSRLR
jgi:septal ring-binding cell division protein DamX